MTRTALTLFVFAVAACTPAPQSWLGIPLPPGTTIVEETDEFLGPGKTLLVAPGDIEGYDEILTFYERHLPTEWERCPSSDIEWAAASGLLPARHTMWSDSEGRRFFWVATADSVTEDLAEEFGESKLMIIGHDSSATTWHLVYRGLCAPRNPELLSPAALISSRFSCGAASRNSAFEANVWREADETTRGLMTDDLICRGLLLGLDQEEVIDLLGEPDTWSEGTFAYRVHMPLNPDLPRLPEGSLECPENWAEIRFDFAIAIPEESYAPFWIDHVCEAVGT